MYKRRKNTLIFASVLGNLGLVEKFIDEICDEYNISSTYFGNILIAVTEAVKNAIIFGNYSDEKKKVILRFDSNSGYLSFTVSDEGKGFDFSDDEVKLIEDIHGYDRSKGLYLIQKLSDIVKFYNNGSKIEMVFHITSINRELAMDRLNIISKYFSKINAAKAELN